MRAGWREAARQACVPHGSSRESAMTHGAARVRPWRSHFKPLTMNKGLRPAAPADRRRCWPRPSACVPYGRRGKRSRTAVLYHWHWRWHWQPWQGARAWHRRCCVGGLRSCFLLKAARACVPHSTHAPQLPPPVLRSVAAALGISGTSPSVERPTALSVAAAATVEFEAAPTLTLAVVAAAGMCLGGMWEPRPSALQH